jgi:Peptidase family M28
LARYALIAACLLAGGYGVYYFGIRDDVTTALRARAREREAIAKQLDEIQFQDETPKKPRTEFAQDRVPGGDADAPKPIDIDAKRVMGYLEQICNIGPRQSGTAGMKKQQELIRKHFEDLGLTVKSQNFTGKQASQRGEVDMTNLVVSIHPERKRHVILCSHYDTRPIADQEPDPRKWREKFISANDGGSGVALLMEFAHHLPKLNTKVGVDLVLFDGEEFIFDRDRDRYFFGSDYFAKNWRATKDRPDYVAAVLFDMIGGRNPRFPVEGYSWQKARELCVDLWRTGEELKCVAFLNRLGDRVMDDHLALQNAGIPAVDVIDFDYPHWHRLSDTPENCSPDGLAQVSKVISVWLQRMK